MKTKLLFFLALLFPAWLAAQASTPDCQFTYSSAVTGSQSPAISNRFTTAGGSPGCSAWIFKYWTNASSVTSVQIEGAADAVTGGVHAPTGAWTALTVSSASGSGANPAIATTSGGAVLCCDYYPWVRFHVLTLSGAGASITVRAYGYRNNSALNGGGGGGGTIPHTTNLLAGDGAGNAADSGLTATLDMTTLGDTIAGGAAGVVTKIAGNTTTSPKVWTQTGDGVNSALPSWQPPGASGNSITYGPVGSLPGSSSTVGNLYICSNSPSVFVWGGSAWTLAGYLGQPLSIRASSIQTFSGGGGNITFPSGSTVGDLVII